MKKTISLLVLIFVSYFSSGQKNYTLEQCKNLYGSSNYQELIPALESLPEEVYVDSSYTINFMLGLSLCKTGNISRGQRVLNWMIPNYDLDPGQIGIINREIYNCGSINNTPVRLGVLELWYNRNSNAGVKSKIYIPNGLSDKTYSSSNTQFIDTLLNREYPNRIIKLDSIVQNKDLPNNRSLNPNFYRSEHFILFGDSRKKEDSLEVISIELERTLRFYNIFFQFKLPENYINVYVLSSDQRLNSFAKDYHRIKLAEKTRGYTFEPDHSIAGSLPTNPAGTLKHELLHLLLHQNFQAVPPWMDEGLSALYEVSVFDNNGLSGRANWRGNIIHDNWGMVNIPDFALRKILIEYSWEKANKDVSNQALVNAISRYFFLFLQENNLLQKYVMAVKNYSPDKSEMFFVEELEKVFKTSYNNINDHYYQWLRAIVKV